MKDQTTFKKLFENCDDWNIGFDPAFNRLKTQRAEIAEMRRRDVRKLNELGFGYIQKSLNVSVGSQEAQGLKIIKK